MKYRQWKNHNITTVKKAINANGKLKCDEKKKLDHWKIKR